MNSRLKTLIQEQRAMNIELFQKFDSILISLKEFQQQQSTTTSPEVSQPPIAHASSTDHSTTISPTPANPLPPSTVTAATTPSSTDHSSTSITTVAATTTSPEERRPPAHARTPATLTTPEPSPPRLINATPTIQTTVPVTSQEVHRQLMVPKPMPATPSTPADPPAPSVYVIPVPPPSPGAQIFPRQRPRSNLPSQIFPGVLKPLGPALSNMQIKIFDPGRMESLPFWFMNLEDKVQMKGKAMIRIAKSKVNKSGHQLLHRNVPIISPSIMPTKSYLPYI